MVVETQVTTHGTEAAENACYSTRAESDGFVFLSTPRIAEGSDGMTLTSMHDSMLQSLMARVMVIPMGLLFKGEARKALLQDLVDYKTAVERASPAYRRHPAPAAHSGATYVGNPFGIPLLHGCGRLGRRLRCRSASPTRCGAGGTQAVSF